MYLNLDTSMPLGDWAVDIRMIRLKARVFERINFPIDIYFYNIIIFLIFDKKLFILRCCMCDFFFIDF